MTDNSKFVLRWEIDNAKARFATGKVESEVFNEGGFKWIAALDRNNNDINNDGDFSLQCEKDHYESWKCEVKMELYLLQSAGGFFVFDAKDPFCFDKNNCRLLQKDRVSWSGVASAPYIINGKLTFELRINIISSEMGQPLDKFDVPNRKSNVILNIGDEKLHVCKELLAIHSPVFDTMFFGNFSENGKEEVEINDVVYEEFLDILHLIYSRTLKITDRTVLHVLKLADQFQMEKILDESKMYLTQSKGIDVVKKLQIADQYNLINLRDRCLQSFTTMAEMKEKLQTSPDHNNFSDGTKAAIYERIMKIL